MGKTMRTAIITGAGQGIGKRTAEVLAERGYALALNDLRRPEDTLKAVRDRGAKAMDLVSDISDEAVCEAFVAAVRDFSGRADVLVNNAGVSCIAPAETLSAADYRRVLEINLVAPFLLSKAFGAMMLAQRSRSIINVASIAGLVGVGDRAAVQRIKTRAHWSDANPCRGMGRPRCSCECGLSWLGKDRNGYSRSSWRKLHGCRYCPPSAHGEVRFA
jgi:NAD(P)-dependent dehydrogenase (short-subunit alcohol dehydrogenase family)